MRRGGRRIVRLLRRKFPVQLHHALPVQLQKVVCSAFFRHRLWMAVNNLHKRAPSALEHMRASRKKRTLASAPAKSGKGESAHDGSISASSAKLPIQSKAAPPETGGAGIKQGVLPREHPLLHMILFAQDSALRASRSGRSSSAPAPLLRGWPCPAGQGDCRPCR